MKRALVTGASGAIGAAIVRRLAAQGFEVIAHANRNGERAQRLVDEVNDTKGAGHAQALVFDVTDAEATQSALTELSETGTVSVLVSNAGIHEDAPMAGMSARQWRDVIDVSLNGFFNVTQPLLLPMMRGRWGRVVAMSSVAGVLGNRGQTNYAAAKSGLHGAVRSLAREVGSRGITVNAVAPGVIESPMTADHFDAETVRTLVPAARMGRADEVAALVGFLVSDEAGYVSGQIIGVDGGMT